VNNVSKNIKSIHPFPARMVPSIALKSLPARTIKPLCILDPMMGSGTSLVIARSLGHHAFGFDIDPLAVTISKSWVSDISPDSIIILAEKVLANARIIKSSISQSDAYPIDADDKTKEFVRYWFNVENRKQLRALSEVITQVNSKNQRQVLWTAFSKLIIAKERGASLAMDLSHSRPHKVAEKIVIKPFDHFVDSVKTIVKRATFTEPSEYEHPGAFAQLGDARKLPLKSNSIDYVITSPPYLNAIDYMRCSKFSLIWMGYNLSNLRDIRRKSVGSENITGDVNDSFRAIAQGMCDYDKLPQREQKILCRYVSDLCDILKETSRVMKKNAKAIFVVGNSSIKGTFVKNSYAISMIGKKYNLKTRSIKRRSLDDSRRYLPPPSHKKSGDFLQSRMREEVIMTMIKE
jgi:DNA modification methylase